MSGACHVAFIFSIEIRSQKFYCPDWPRIMILLMSASRVPWDDRHEPTARSNWFRFFGFFAVLGPATYPTPPALSLLWVFSR
jgi:hypothetical protein